MIPLIEEIVADVDDPYNICQGHDFFTYIGIYVYKKYKIPVKHKTIPRFFRSSYSMEEFKNTKLFSNLYQYSTLNGLNILL